MSSASRTFASLPPGTVSPVMASSVMAAGGRRQMTLGHLRSRAMEQAVGAAQAAAAAAQAAASSALDVAGTEPSDPTAEVTAEEAIAAQNTAFDQSREAQDAAYSLEQLRRLRAPELPQRRYPSRSGQPTLVFDP